jgi:hypothetical protein
MQSELKRSLMSPRVHDVVYGFSRSRNEYGGPHPKRRAGQFTGYSGAVSGENPQGLSELQVRFASEYIAALQHGTMSRLTRSRRTPFPRGTLFPPQAD